MLASLIIRLALSRELANGCNIIALDEPTTNMDDEKVNCFAQQLKKLIEREYYRSNFHLIIITHSEKFINEINDNFKHYYKVELESDGKKHSFSQITKVIL